MEVSEARINEVLIESKKNDLIKNLRLRDISKIKRVIGNSFKEDEEEKWFENLRLTKEETLAITEVVIIECIERVLEKGFGKKYKIVKI